MALTGGSRGGNNWRPPAGTADDYVPKTSGGVVIWVPASSIGAGETNTASNVGGEAEVFKAKTGVDLAFRTIEGAGGVTVTQNTNTLTIDGTSVSGSGSGAPTAPPGTPKVWFKADAGITVNGSNQPTAITNHGSLGGTFTLDGTATKRGTIISAGWDGKNVLRIDGIDDYLKYTFGSTVTDVVGELFIAFRRRGTGSSPRGLANVGKSGAASNNNDGRWVVYHPDAFYERPAQFTNSSEIYPPWGQATDPGVQNAPQIVETGRDGDVRYVGVNGQITNTSTGDAKAAVAHDVNRLIIGAWATADGDTPNGWGLVMDLMEVIWYNGSTPLTPSERDTMRRYLASRWAIPIASAGGAGSGGGSGTALYSKWDPFVPDSTPHTLNAEFDSSSLAAFTIVNSRGTLDANTSAPGKLLSHIASQQYRFVALLQALPGDTNWTVHTHVNVATNHSSATVAVAGIVISDTNTTNTGKQTTAAYGSVGDVPRPVKLTWDNFGETASGAGSTSWYLGGGHCFIRFRKQSGTYYAAWSVDGVTWFENVITIYGGITPAYIGPYTQNYTGADSEFTFDYFRYYANGTQYLTGALIDVIG